MNVCTSFSSYSSNGTIRHSWQRSPLTVIITFLALFLLIAGASMAQLPVQYNMSTAPAGPWTYTGSWGYWNAGWGAPDPSTADSGPPRWVGYAHAANYLDTLAVSEYASTAAINCSGFANISLSFARYLGVRAGDNAAIEVSGDNGTNWTQVWSSAGAAVIDGAWALQTFNISAYAKNQSQVKVRWSWAQ